MKKFFILLFLLFQARPIIVHADDNIFFTSMGAQKFCDEMKRYFEGHFGERDKSYSTAEQFKQCYSDAKDDRLKFHKKLVELCEVLVYTGAKMHYNGYTREYIIQAREGFTAFNKCRNNFANKIPEDLDDLKTCNSSYVREYPESDNIEKYQKCLSKLTFKNVSATSKCVSSQDGCEITENYVKCANGNIYFRKTDQLDKLLSEMKRLEEVFDERETSSKKR